MLEKLIKRETGILEQPAIKWSDEVTRLIAESCSNTLKTRTIWRSRIGEISRPWWNGTVVQRPAALRNCLC